MKNATDIEKALKTFSETKSKYELYRRYYNGDHVVAFDTEKFNTAVSDAFRSFAETYKLNLCPAVCDALKDKLIVENFRAEDGADKKLAEEIWKIWQDNLMEIRSDEVHDEAIVMGDAYVQVWVDPNKKVTIYPQRADRCSVFYDEEIPGKILWAAKYWFQPDRKMRLTLFYPDRVERYVSKKEIPAGRIPQKATDFKEFTGEGKSVIKNPYNQVPIFHFANNGKTGQRGKSELADAIPVQDSLNRAVMDKMVAMQFASFLQRWAIGIEDNLDEDGNPISPFIAGVEKVWTTENPEAKFGVFPASDLNQFLQVKDSAIIDMARVTGTPLWYFIQTDGFPSGEALQKSGIRFINKVSNRMLRFGQSWADAMAFALRIEKGTQDSFRLFTNWKEPEPISRKEELENILLETELGLPKEQALIEAGYGEEDVKRFKEMAAQKREEAVRQFNSGEEIE